MAGPGADLTGTITVRINISEFTEVTDPGSVWWFLSIVNVSGLTITMETPPVYLKVFLERFKWEVKTHTKYGGEPSHGLNIQDSLQWEEELSTCSHLSVSWLDLVWSAASCACCHDGLTIWTMSPTKLLLSELVVYFILATRNVTSTEKKIATRKHTLCDKPDTEIPRPLELVSKRKVAVVGASG